jgi:hypothetical protein
MACENRQLIVLCDGTSNTLSGGVQDTNVLKLALHLRKHSDPQQIIWYDPGVGSDAALPGVSWQDRIKGEINRLTGLAEGGGVYENMAEALTFLAQVHREDDQIFLFGFSRGAFTARAIAGFINEYGLPAPHALHLLPMMLNRYFSKGKDPAKIQRIVEDTRQAAASRMPEIQFVGVWDTVEAVGLPIPWLYKKITNPASIDGKCFLNVRHAVALDEQRVLFKPRLYEISPNQIYTTHSGKPATLMQVGFPGCHADVGGGYKWAGLSDLALHWMALEAQNCGLRMPTLPSASPDSHHLRHSEIHTAPLWAMTGLCVRDTQKIKPHSSLIETQHATTQPKPSSVWAEYGVPWRLELSVGIGISLLAYWWLSQIDPQKLLTAWQLWPFKSKTVDLPLSCGDIKAHLLIDTFILIPALVVVMAVLTCSAFAHVAGTQSAERPAPPYLNHLGLALPLYLGADLLENLLTWLTVLAIRFTKSITTNGTVEASGIVGIGVLYITPICATLMAFVSFVKYLGFCGAILLCVRGLVGRK